MAKVTLNPVLEAIRGKVGDLVFRRVEDQVIVGKMPDRTGIVPTAEQLAQQDEFRLAVLYGKAVLADEEQKAIYDVASDRKGIPAFALMVGDFLNEPAIPEISLADYAGEIGDTIVIRASDDVQVAGVNVTIRTPEGVVLEQGAAVAGGGAWTYTATTTLEVGQTVSIDVTATDLAGHIASRSESHG
ncbi:MAG: hypothetical protein AB9869_26710 [Verrucomicrobiia bacterium]